eukprot:Rmarinus@m.882
MRFWQFVCICTLFLCRANCFTSGVHESCMIGVGHTHTDTDSVTAALAFEAIFPGGVAARAGPLNSETEFVLEYFGVPQPPLVAEIPGAESCGFYLLDHNTLSQASDGVDESRILGVIDHHPLAEDSLGPPVKLDVRVVGSTATILFDYALSMGVPLSQSTAGLLFGAIVSDTLNLRSSTTTPLDESALQDLARIAGVTDISGFADRMFSAKAAEFNQRPAAELVSLDSKAYEGHLLQFSTLETMDPKSLLDREAELRQAMEDFSARHGMRYGFIAIVDIRSLVSHVLASDDVDLAILEVAYGVPRSPAASSKRVVLDGKVSRKKDLVPPLLDCLHSPQCGGMSEDHCEDLSLP